MALLATQDVNYTGLTPSYGAATGGGDTLTPDGDTFLHVKNGGGSSINVTIVTPNTIAGIAIADVVVAVPNASERMIGPFPASIFADPTNSGLTTINYSGVTSVTVAVLRAKTPAGA